MIDNDEADEKKAFNLRDFPVAERKFIKDCANRAGLTMPEWIVMAAHTQARVDAHENVFPPAHATASNGVSVSDDIGLLDLLNAAGAATGGRPRAVPGLVSLLAARVREAKGLPPLAPRKNHVKQFLRISKTEREMSDAADR